MCVYKYNIYLLLIHGMFVILIQHLKASTNKASFINVNNWITFQYIDQLLPMGDGKLDGQGSST